MKKSSNADMTVKPMKDTMAKNIGDHMGAASKKVAVKKTGGKKGKK